MQCAHRHHHYNDFSFLINWSLLVCTQIFHKRNISQLIRSMIKQKSFLKTIFLNLVKKNIKAKKRDCNRNGIYTSLVFCLSQNWKRIFLEKQNLNRIFGGGLLMIHFSFGSMEKNN